MFFINQYLNKSVAMQASVVCKHALWRALALRTIDNAVLIGKLNH
jgi:hypothetical protein